MTKLFTDTSANLPLRLLTAHHIEVLPFSYTVDGKPVPYSETTDFDGKAFYDAMRAGAVVKTSMINTETFREHFTRALEAGDDVLYVGMSGGISGTAGAAALTVRELKEAYPDRKIAAIDTFAASLGEGLQVLNAARMLEEGRTFEEVESYLLDSRHNMCQQDQIAGVLQRRAQAARPVRGALHLIALVRQLHAHKARDFRVVLNQQDLHAFLPFPLKVS